MDGEPGFAEHGSESKPERAKKTKNSLLTPTTGDDFLWILSLFVQRKYLALSESEKTQHDKQRKVSSPSGTK